MKLSQRRGKEMYNVTNVKIIPSKKQTKMKAFADITLDNILTLRGWKVINGSRELFVAPPSQKAGDQYYDNILFIDGNKKGSDGDRLRQFIQSEVLKKYGGIEAEAANMDQTRESGPAEYDDEVPF